MSKIMADAAVLAQIHKLKAAGVGLTRKSVHIDSGSKLPTCNEYRMWIGEINRAMSLFKDVVLADAQQIKQFYEDMEAQDNA